MWRAIWVSLGLAACGGESATTAGDAGARDAAADTGALDAAADGAADAGPPAEPTSVRFEVPDDLRALFTESLADLAAVTVGGEAADSDTLRVAVTRDERCAECYRVERRDGGYVVLGGGALGLQYGVAATLEGLGFRFFHPFATRAPDRLRTAGLDALLGRDFAPDIPVRGLHLHTLHPIEALYAFWLPGAENREHARRVLDWVVRQRGNAIQWVALEDIVRDTDVHTAWKSHTRAILDAAHARGLSVGLGIQVFGQSNLQRAFDLVDGDFNEDEVRSRLRLITEDLPFDRYNMSFGEFVGADPDQFVQTVDRVYEILHALAPEAEVPATIHVGDYEDLRVEYRGERLLYYFLVKFANPAIIPWIHTVMYFDLYEDAGGAYAHDAFDEHRAFLEDRVRRGEPVGYFPETAYWIAFDVSVPTFLPLYVRTRHLDLARIREVGRLPQHVLFSSGWEWGYWLNDLAALRMSYALPADPEALFADIFAPYGTEVVDGVARVAELQHAALVGGRLAAYLAGRDALIDAGDRAGIIAAPDRPQPTEVAAFDDGEKAAFVARVVEPLEALAADLRSAGEDLTAVPGDDAFLAELRDGVEVTALRAAFVAAIYRAATTDAGALDDAEATLESARAVVARRHGRLHAPRAERLVVRGDNPTIYKFGYLLWAHGLCYWERERVEVARLLGRTAASLPACAL